MPPGADAVSLINRERDQLAGGGMLLKHRAGGFSLQTLRREIQQPQTSLAELRQRLPSLSQLDAAMKTGCRDASTAQLQHLIFHQSHQW